MIGEVVTVNYYHRKIDGKEIFKCAIRIDEELTYVYLDPSATSSYLIANFLDIDAFPIPGFSLLHKLIPMIRSRFQDRTHWTPDWDAMRRQYDYWKAHRQDESGGN